METEERKYKVVLVGDGGVGKTSLVKRFVYSKYADQYIKTIGTNIYRKDLITFYNDKRTVINLQIWDIMGQKVFPQVIATSMSGARGVIFVTDLTNKQSLLNIPDWVQTVFENNDETAFVFLANKSDVENIQFGENALKSVAEGFKSPHFLTSAKTGDNVEKAFEALGNLMLSGSHVPKSTLGEAKKRNWDVPEVVLLEDNLINYFCNKMGGYEFAMPIVRTQMHELKIDFEHPTTMQIKTMTHKLTEIIKQTKSVSEAKVLEKDLNGFIRSIEHLNIPVQ